MRMFMYMHRPVQSICIYTLHACIHACVHECLCVAMYVYVSICMNMYRCIRICVAAHVLKANMLTASAVLCYTLRFHSVPGDDL